MSNPKITIGIPTYNRAIKLNRSLTLLSQFYKKEIQAGILEILVVDNCSTDETKKILEKFNSQIKNFQFFIQDCNIGYDLNVLTVYKKSQSQYIWLFADDDIPYKNALNEILFALDNRNVDILLFSFAQPKHSVFKAFNFESKVHYIYEPKEIISLVLKYPKISIYILKKVHLTNSDMLEINNFVGDGWMHLVLCFTILTKNNINNIAIISNVLAHSDDEFDMLTYPIDAFENSYKIANHSYINTFSPNLIRIMKKNSYLDCIQFAYAAKCGSLRIIDKSSYEFFIKNVNWKLIYLWDNPKKIIQLFLLKFNLVTLFFKPKIQQ
jgi:glycosyltransferase involved in cell wall biosynthesis